MTTDWNENSQEPIGRILKRISLLSQSFLQSNLTNIDIKHSFYPLVLIEMENGMTQQELARKLSCDKVQVVRIINYLSSNGYVNRIQNQLDKRKYKLQVTDKALKIIPEIKNAFQKTVDLNLKGLTQNQIAELYKTLSIIESNLISQKKIN